METKSKRKGFKYISKYILLFLFVCGGTFMGVALALSLVDVPIGGKIIFNATNIYAQVTGTVTGSKSENTLDVLNFNYDSPAFTTPNSWSNMKLDFEADKNIELTITIKNLSDEREIWVTFVENIKAGNVSTARSVDGTTVSAFTNQVVSKSGTKVIKLIWRVENPDEEVTNGTFNLDITLTNERVAVDESVYAESMSFTSFDTSAKTCSVKNGTDTTITSLDIPSSIIHNGEVYTVTEVASNGFNGCSAIESVTFPNTIKTIGNSAFLGCTSIKSLTLPESVTTISAWAFCNCTSLESIDILGEVTAINERTFNNCIALKEFTIPASVNSIGKTAFNNCPKLSSVIFKNLVSWSVTDSTQTLNNIDVTSATNNATLLKTTYLNFAWSRSTPKDTDYAGLSFTYDNTNKTASVKGADSTQTSIIIPNEIACNQTTSGGGTVGTTYTVTTIDSGAFSRYTSLEYVFIPNTITTIKSNAFQENSSLKSLYIPASATSVATLSVGTRSLEAIEVESGNPNYYSISNTVIYKANMSVIGACKNSVLPEGVRQIANWVLAKSQMENINIPSTVTYIGSGAFNNCSNLVSIEIPAAVKTIGANAFGGCGKLTSVEFKNTSGWTVTSGSTTATPALSTTDYTYNATLLKTYVAYAWTRA